VSLSSSKRLLLAIAAAPYLYLSMFSCGSTVAPQQGASSPNALAIAASGDLHGYIAPCGCTKPMLGGLTRRATLIRQLGAGVVALENGDLIEGGGRQDQLKAETIVDMLGAMRYDAINLGEHDFMLGLPYLQSLQQRFSGSLISANVFDEAGNTVAKPVTIVQKRIGTSDVRIGVMGVLSPEHTDAVAAMNPGLELRAPETAIEANLGMLAGCAVRILMVHGTKGEAEDLSRRFPTFQVVVYAHQDDPTAEPFTKGGVTFICSGNKGRNIGIARLSSESWSVESLDYRKIGPEFTDDKATEAIRRAYLGRVVAENLLASVPKSALEKGQAFVGSESCASCHASAHRVWKDSFHSKAYATLQKEGHELDPECVGCHVVGLERKGGFESLKKTPKLTDVGCESCHGAARQHVQNPTRARLPKVGENSCKPCHVPDHSPTFNFATYWKRIAH
jgi:hypothetical protein